MQPDSCSQYLGAIIGGPISFGWMIYTIFAIFYFLYFINTNGRRLKLFSNPEFYKGLAYGVIWLALVLVFSRLLPFWGFNLLFLSQMIWVSRKSSIQEHQKVELRLLFAIPLFALPCWRALTSSNLIRGPLPSSSA